MRVRAHVFVAYKFFGQTSRFFIANIGIFGIYFLSVKCLVESKTKFLPRHTKSIRTRSEISCSRTDRPRRVTTARRHLCSSAMSATAQACFRFARLCLLESCSSTTSSAWVRAALPHLATSLKMSSRVVMRHRGRYSHSRAMHGR